MRQLKSFFKATIVAITMWAMSAHASIPFNNKAADKEFGRAIVPNLQIANLGLLNGADTPARVNMWGGRQTAGAVIGNWPGDVSKPTPSNENWSIHLISDGRFTIRPTAQRNVCLTVEKQPSSLFQAEFGDSGRVVKLERCDSASYGQQFFLQLSGTAKKTVLSGSAAYVLRPVDDPGVCLTTFSNSRKPNSLSPLTVAPCSGAGDESDRWVITSIQETARADTQKTLKQVATIWAMQDYADDKGHSVYNKSVSAEAVKSTVKVDPTTRYTRLQFGSPFGGRSVNAYTNATPHLQELHIERFDTSGFDKSIEIGSSKLNGLSTWLTFLPEIKVKLDFKKSVQDNVKLWQKVPPYTTIFFAAGTIKVSGGFNVVVVTDLGDTWETAGGTFGEDVVSTIVACTDTSTDKICSQISD